MSESTMIKTPGGTTVWRNAAGDLHRTDGPAFIGRRGEEEYYINGKRISKKNFDILNGKEIKVSPKDECQVCAGTFSLKNGLLVKHGFKRPGTGRLYGQCMGEGHPPFPDTKALVQYRVNLQDWVSNMQKAVDKYNNGEVKTIERTSPLGTKLVYNIDTDDTYTWEREIGRAKRNAEDELNSLQNELVRVTERIEKANEMKKEIPTESLRSVIRDVLKEAERDHTADFKYAPIADEELSMELLGWMADARDGITIKHFVEVTEAERSKVVQAMKKLVLDGLAERGEGRSYGEQEYHITDAGRKAFRDYMTPAAPKEVDESWLDNKSTAKKLSKTIEKKYGKGFGGKVKWADEWSDNPKAVAGALAKVVDEKK